MREFLIETQSGEPTPRQMHAQLFHQFAFAADAIQIADQENAQQKFGIDGRAARLTVAVFQLQPYELKWKSSKAC